MPSSDATVRAAAHDECHEEVTRAGHHEPCEKPAVAVRIDPNENLPYPVCARHCRAPMVPLPYLVHSLSVAAVPSDPATVEAAARALYERDYGFWPPRPGNTADTNNADQCRSTARCVLAAIATPTDKDAANEQEPAACVHYRQCPNPNCPCGGH